MQFSADTWHDPATFAINRLPGRSVPLGRGTLDGERGSLHGRDGEHEVDERHEHEHADGDELD